MVSVPSISKIQQSRRSKETDIRHKDRDNAFSLHQEMSYRQLPLRSILLFIPHSTSLRQVREMLIRYDDGRQQLQGKAAKTLAGAILEREVD